MKTTTYVQSVEAFQSVSGRVTFCRVKLATGHTYTCHPDEVPTIGAPFEVEAVPA